MPVRGLRLFVRPIEAADHEALAAFFARQNEGVGSGLRSSQSAADPAQNEDLTPPSGQNEGLTPPSGQKEGLTPAPAWGLLGKLLGDVVAVVALRITDDALRVEGVTVARELRRKWIGRVMMREVEQLAVKMDRRRIVVEDAGDAQEFFRRVGFQSEGERWVRVVP
jgi:ribosomal protein S18 acetylase RimI-like enzyme